MVRTGCVSFVLAGVIGLLGGPIVAQERDAPANGQRTDDSSQTTQPQNRSGERDGEAGGSRVALGVMIAPTPGSGVLVLDVRPGSPAAEAGLRFGDYILSLDGAKISSPEDVTNALANKRPGDEISILRWRNGDERELQARLASRDLFREGFLGEGQPRADSRPWVGIVLSDSRQQDGQTPMRIERVYPNGPAARAGLQTGDVIRGIDGQEVSEPQEFVQLLRQHQPGDDVKVRIERDGSEQEITVRLGSQEEFGFNLGQFQRGFRGDEGFEHPFGEGMASRFFQDREMPDFGMRWESEREAAEQRQRIENLVRELSKEVQALREELRARRGQNATADPGKQPQ